MTKTTPTYYQGGADFSGKRTKSNLKRAIKEEPQNVYLYDTTAPILGGPKWTGMASELPEGVIFNVVGPDPFTDRSWYASVYRGKDGVVRVK